MKEWFTVFEQYRRTNCIASDLIMGNEYVFRVFAINQVGLSDEACNTKDSAYIQKTGLALNAKTTVMISICDSDFMPCKYR